MLKKTIIILLFISPFYLYSIDEIKNGFKIEITFAPQIEDNNISRGATLTWNSYLTQNFYWGLSTRIMNKDYTSIYTLLGADINLNDFFSIPINFGLGFKIKSFDLSSDNEEGLKPFIDIQAGFKWKFDPNWSYTLSGVYNYNFYNDETYIVLISLGIMYLF